HDMSGNVWEWVQDRHGVYPGTPQVDPPGAASGSFRVRRGGSWGNNVLSPPRSVLRNNDIPDFRWNVNGFRLARPAP
ncbi:MAG: SUMF1/EgtB/PvdO family nonheme iron enzyme, partial [Treponema sp.]|nr:SUMF1/EgtB/PvdO family nonheme iron enzyme [Treponema sp.]